MTGEERKWIEGQIETLTREFSEANIRFIEARFGFRDAKEKYRAAKEDVETVTGLLRHFKKELGINET
jgi:hypothetical protein